jgi:hypothetical protein
MKPGSTTAPQSVPNANVDDAAEVNRFRTAAQRWEQYTGPLRTSPLFGDQPKDKLTALHCVHAAHHLSFLTPKPS